MFEFILCLYWFISVFYCMMKSKGLEEDFDKFPLYFGFYFLFGIFIFPFVFYKNYIKENE